MRLPQDTDTMMYLMATHSGYTIGELLERVRAKFGEDVELDNFTIESEHIQIDCFGYDQYDPADWRTFFVIIQN